MLSKNIDAYLAVRRAVGSKLKSEEFRLRSFARAASARGERYVRTKTAIDWAAGAATPRERERRLRIIASFARHVRAEDRRHEVPPVDVFGRHAPRRRIPHLYSTTEIRRLMKAASRLGPTGSLRPYAFETLIGLIAATGLRISEALALKIADATSDVLVVRETKLRKSRLVPLHATAAAALCRYLERRRRWQTDDDSLFVSATGSALSYWNAWNIFARLVQMTGLGHGNAKRQPRLHDLRHTFAVRALEASPDGGSPVGRHIHALTTYLGHSTLANTYWYFQATPRLMRSVADRCEAHLNGGAR